VADEVVVKKGVNVSRRVELMLALLMLLTIVLLHVIIMFSAGPLWRDEANTVFLATKVSFAENLNQLDRDSFPILWFLVLRLWTVFFGVDSDFVLRILGFLMGMSVLGAIWTVIRQFGYRVPLLGMMLLGLSPVVLRVGDSVRAYGLGMVTMLLALAAVWRMVQRPNGVRIIIAAIAMIISVQSVYYNAVIVFAMCLAAAAVGCTRKSVRLIVASLGIGAVAAISLTPYIPTIEKLHTWNMLVKQDQTLASIWGGFPYALPEPREFMPWIWSALYVGAIMECVVTLGWRKPDAPSRERAIFLLTALVVGLVAYVAFLFVLDYPTNPWYYLMAITFLAVLMDMALQRQGEGASRRRWVVAGMSLFILILSWNGALAESRLRQTSIDLVAQSISRHATPDDLVIVNPWWCGVSFDRYYGGLAPWTTLPDIDEHGVHRYDLIKEVMQHEDTNSGLRDRVDKVLKSGNRLILVGGWSFPEYTDRPTRIGPAPIKEFGWFLPPYVHMWGIDMSYYIQSHITKIEVFTVVDDLRMVNPFEGIIFYVAEGWHDVPPVKDQPLPSPWK